MPPGELTTTIVTYEEQARGWLAYASRARSVSEQVSADGRLGRHLDFYRGIPVLPFNEPAAVVYQRLRKLRPRLGTMDLRIAAIALSQRATLLTRNRVDFATILGLSFEDWSA